MRIMRDCKTGASPEENWLNAFVALGILKLDEPKTAFEKFKMTMTARGWSDMSAIWPDISHALNSHDLKIVEK